MQTWMSEELAGNVFMEIWGEGCRRKRTKAVELHGFENGRKRAELEAQEHESEGPITYIYKYINLKPLKFL